MIKGPELIKKITIKDFDHFVNHRKFVDAEEDPFFSQNLFSITDEKWRNMRATLSPSFTSSKMKFMFGLIDECAKEFVDYFKNKKSKVLELEMRDTLRRFTNDVIASAAYGIKIHSLEDKKNDFFLMGEEATNFGGLRSLTFVLYALSPTLCKVNY